MAFTFGHGGSRPTFAKLAGAAARLGTIAFALLGAALAQAAETAAAPLPAALPAAGPASTIPVDAFFQPAKLRAPALSHSGRWLAVLTSVPGKRVGFLMIDLEGGEAQRFIEAAPDADVAWFRWVNDEWLIFALSEPGIRGSDRRGPGLMSMKRDGSESKQLVRRSYDAFLSTDEPVNRRRALEPNHTFLGLGTPGTREIILGEMHYDQRREYSHMTPRVLDVATRELRSMLTDAPRATGLMLDPMRRARLLIDSRDGQVVLHWSDTGEAPWRQISKAPRYDQPFGPAFIDKDGLVVEVSKGNTSELFRLDLATGLPTGAAILAVPGFDIDAGARVSPGSADVAGLTLTVDAQTTVWFEPAMQRLQAEVDTKFPGRVNMLSCRPCDNPRVVLVESYSDVQPGEFLIYKPQQRQWLALGSRRPDIDPRRMARLEFHRTRARDGADLPVWVTRPASAAGKPAPAVVLVHGGPWVRGTQWQWDGDAQFLA